MKRFQSIVPIYQLVVFLKQSIQYRSSFNSLVAKQTARNIRCNILSIVYRLSNDYASGIKTKNKRRKYCFSITGRIYYIQPINVLCYRRHQVLVFVFYIYWFRKSLQIILQPSSYRRLYSKKPISFIFRFKTTYNSSSVAPISKQTICSPKR